VAVTAAITASEARETLLSTVDCSSTTMLRAYPTAAANQTQVAMSTTAIARTTRVTSL
jgi:hypothetical protein